jgi:hypothetical protein
LSEIVKGVLGGGLALVAGWILPTALNVLLVGLLDLPNFQEGRSLIDAAAPSAAGKAALLVGAAVVFGLVLNVLQTPLYRVLEGYLLWPQWAFEKRRQRHVNNKARIAERLKLIRWYQDDMKALREGSDGTNRTELDRIRQSAESSEMGSVAPLLSVHCFEKSYAVTQSMTARFYRRGSGTPSGDSRNTGGTTIVSTPKVCGLD